MKHYDVVAAVIIDQDEVLCMQRGQTRFDYTSYKWEFPGGKIEVGESAAGALQREIKEELDMDIRVGQRLITVNHTYPDFSITMQCFVCSVASRVLDMKEHAAYKWTAPSDLHSLDWAAADIDVMRFAESWLLTR